MIGQGFPDLAVGWRGKTLLLELKDGDLCPSKRRLTPDEQVFFDMWAGHVCVIQSIDEALGLLEGTQ